MIYYWQTSSSRIYLIYRYLKSEVEHLTPQQLKVLASLMKDIGDG